jgi:hypothetical protein
MGLPANQCVFCPAQQMCMHSKSRAPGLYSPCTLDGHSMRRQQSLQLDTVRHALTHTPQLSLLAAAPSQQGAACGHARSVVCACTGASGTASLCEHTIYGCRVGLAPLLSAQLSRIRHPTSVQHSQLAVCSRHRPLTHLMRCAKSGPLLCWAYKHTWAPAASFAGGSVSVN